MKKARCVKKKLNMNDFARVICELEGKEQNVDIAQIKETLSRVAYLLRFHPEYAAVFLQYVMKAK